MGGGVGSGGERKAASRAVGSVSSWTIAVPSVAVCVLADARTLHRFLAALEVGELVACIDHLLESCS